MTTIPSEAPPAIGPFIATTHQVAQYAECPLSEVLLAIETGELQALGGSPGLVQVRHATAWVKARADKAEGAPSPAPTAAPTVNPLTGLVHHEVEVDVETGRPIR